MLLQILEIVLIPVLGALTTYLISYLRVKSAELETTISNNKQEKYLRLL